MARLLLHTISFPPDANSNAYVFADLAREFMAMGHEVTVLTTTPHYNRVEEDLRRQPLVPMMGRWLLRSEFAGASCYHVRVPAEKGGIWSRVWTAIRFHVLGLVAVARLRLRFDVVLSQSPPLTLGLVSAIMARRRGARSVYVAQDIFPDGLITQGRIRNPIVIRLLRWLERTVYACSDAVCSISEGLVALVRERAPAGADVRCVPNFVDTELYRPLPRRNAFSEAHELSSSFVVSYLGNMGNAQNFEPVIAAAEALRGSPVRFVLAGGGMKQEALALEADRRRLDTLLVLGYQAREVTPLVNAASDLCLVLLSPHVKNFSFPSKVYTIMASGRPILLYGNPQADVARFVADRGIGWVVPDGDVEGFIATVKRLAAEPAALRERGARALELARAEYSAPAVARRYDQLFTDLLQGAR